MNYILNILVMINIYSILALSLNLLVGYTGLLSLCQAAFYGIGAYISTLLIIKVGLGFLPSLILAIAGAVLLSLVISVPSLRLKGDYFVLASLGFQIIVFYVIYNWKDLTNGSDGILDIPSPKVFGIEFDSIPSYFIFSSIIALTCAGLLYLIGNSPFGRVLKAIREDEIAAASLGKNIIRFKIIAFAIAAGFAAIPGALFAGHMHYIEPTSFTFMESIFIISIIIIGGTGNISGPIIGAILMVVLPEALRFLGLPNRIAPDMRQIIYGALIILIMRYRPQGLLGEYRLE